MSQPMDATGISARTALTQIDSKVDSASKLVGTSFQSNAGSSVISNGSLLDLYARSPNSVAASNDGISPSASTSIPGHHELGQPEKPNNAPPVLPPRTAHKSDARKQATSIETGIPNSISGTSLEWTAASAKDIESNIGGGGKRASVAGFDAEMLSSIRPAFSTLSFTGEKGTDSSMQRSRPRANSNLRQEAPFDDSESEGSQYDDYEEEEEASQSAQLPATTAKYTQKRPDLSITSPSTSGFDKSGTATGESTYTAADWPRRGDHDSDAEEQYANALPSPPVPRRTSSVHLDSAPASPAIETLVTGWLSHLRESSEIKDQSLSPNTLARRPSLVLHSSQIPLRRSSSEMRRSEDSRPPAGLEVMAGEHTSPTKRTTPRTSADMSRNNSSENARLSQRSVLEATGRADSPFRSSTSSKVETLQVVKEDALPEVEKGKFATDKLSPQTKEAKPVSAEEISAEERARLEKELLAESFSSDSARPRTLQEARERARLRREKSEAQAAAAQVSSGPDVKKPSKDVKQKLVAVEAPPRRSTDSVERPVRDPRRLSAKESMDAERRMSLSSNRSAPSDYSHSSEVEPDQGYESGGYSDMRGSIDDVGQGTHLPDGDISGYAAAAGIEELTAAVSSAMEDLSFGSADDYMGIVIDSTTPLARTGQQANRDLPQTSEQLAALSRDEGSLDREPETPRQAMMQRFEAPSNVPRAVPSRSSSVRYAQPLDASPAPPVPAIGQQLFTEPSTFASSAAGRSVQPATPVTPKVPSRIDVYGKTIPMPRSFLGSAVMENKKAAPWERARTYAQYCNDLLALQTGLAVWLDAVQRPAMRQQQAGLSQDLPTQDARVGGHVRNDGSYAASIRSDLTFPMRGDGGKAKELVSALPTMPESPPSAVPSNLPYPMLVEQRSNSTSTFVSSPASQTMLSSPHESVHSNTISKGSGLTPTGGSRSGPAGGFFSSLGRKGSRRTPGSGTVSSLAQNGLSSITGVGGPRGHRAKGKTISGPIVSGSERQSTDGDSTGSLDSVAAARLMAISDSSGSATRLATVAESGNARASPMGPRAPGPGSTPTYFSILGKTPSNESNRTVPQASPGDIFSSNKVSGNSSQVLDQEQGSRDQSFSGNVRSSFSYGTVRDKKRNGTSPDPSGGHEAGFQEALNKLADVLPDADTPTLTYYLKRAKGNDLVAIGDYLQDQSLGKLLKNL